MKYGIKCKVESRTRIGTVPIQITYRDIDYSFIPTKEQFFGEITAITKVDDIKEFEASFKPTKVPSLAKFNVTINASSEIVNNLIEAMQYLESYLSFLWGVEKIYYEEYENIFIPENDVEKEKVNIKGFLQKQRYPDKPITNFSQSAFNQVLEHRNKFDYLTVKKAYHREGSKDFRAFRYVGAYYNFYFVLEDFYGEGKTNNNQIAEKFRNNQNLRDVIQDVLQTHISGRHRTIIEQFIQEENKHYMNFDIDGIIEMIVMVRGNLHHFSSKSSKRKGTPFNQRDFESVAYLLMCLSLKSILKAHNQTLEEIKQNQKKEE